MMCNECILMRETPEGHQLVYHPASREYEIFANGQRERFPAIYPPHFGPDVHDIQAAEEVLNRLAPASPTPLDTLPSQASGQ